MEHVNHLFIYFLLICILLTPQLSPLLFVQDYIPQICSHQQVRTLKSCLLTGDIWRASQHGINQLHHMTWLRGGIAHKLTGSWGRETFLFLDALLTPFFLPLRLLEAMLQLLGDRQGRGSSHYEGQLCCAKLL